jgi:acyl-CoA thioester hydrolase
LSRPPLDGREVYRVWREIGTRWADNDAYGHVNNTIYYGWFDTAVNAWLVEAGLLDVERGDPIGLVVDTGCRYARPLAFPEPVEVGLAVERLGSSSVRYRLGVFAKGSGEAAAEGHFVHVYVDRETRRPAPLPETWRRKLAELVLPGTGRINPASP